jgi:hypothetical protein
MAGTGSIRSDGVVCSEVRGLGRTPIAYSSDLEWKRKRCSTIAHHEIRKSYIIASIDHYRQVNNPEIQLSTHTSIARIVYQRSLRAHVSTNP